MLNLPPSLPPSLPGAQGLSPPGQDRSQQGGRADGSRHGESGTRAEGEGER